MRCRCLGARKEEGEDDDAAGVGALGIQGRLGGRSPLSWRIATRVAHPLVFTSCMPSAGS